jgi:hypothetical protein
MIDCPFHIRRKRYAAVSTSPSVVREFLREFVGDLTATNPRLAIRIISAMSSLIRYRNQRTRSTTTTLLTVLMQKIRRDIDSIPARAQAFPNKISPLAFTDNLNGCEHSKVLPADIPKVGASATGDPPAIQSAKRSYLFSTAFAHAQPYSRSLLSVCPRFICYSAYDRESPERLSSQISKPTATAATCCIAIPQISDSSSHGFSAIAKTSPQNTAILRAANWFNGCEIPEHFSSDVRASMLRKVYNLGSHAVRDPLTKELVRLSSVFDASLRAALILSQASV